MNQIKIKIDKDLNLRLLLALSAGEIDPDQFPEFAHEGGFLDLLVVSSADEAGPEAFTIPLTIDLKKRLLKALSAGEIDMADFPEFTSYAFAAFDQFLDRCRALADADRADFEARFK